MSKPIVIKGWGGLEGGNHGYVPTPTPDNGGTGPKPNSWIPIV